MILGKKRFYRSVDQISELKADFIRITETDEEPRYYESQEIIRETVEASWKE